MRRSSLAAGVMGLVAVAAGCRHAAAPAPLPLEWPQLAGPPQAFAALYRFSCCSRTGLLATVRAGGGTVDLTVVMQPAGVVARAWLHGNEGWVMDEKAGCRRRLAGGELPVSGGVTLPLDAPLAALLLTGRVPEGARPLPEHPGWVEARTGGVVWRARIEGAPVHCSRVTVDRDGRTLLDARLSRTRPDGMPGAVVIDAGREHMEMVLTSWHRAEVPGAPRWMDAAVCGDAP